MRFLKIGLFLGMSCIIAGCTSDIAKSIDAKMSEYIGMPCSSQNLAAGESYCSRPEAEMVQAPVYCYKTLGATNCYTEKNPYGNEKSERVRPVMALGSHGTEILTAEEYELRMIMSERSVADVKKNED